MKICKHQTLIYVQCRDGLTHFFTFTKEKKGGGGWEFMLTCTQHLEKNTEQQDFENCSIL